MKYIISIDPSLTSTAITVKNVSTNSSYEFYSFFKHYKPKNKWCKSLDHFVHFEKVEFIEDENFSKNELLKLQQYTELVNLMVTRLKPFLFDDVIINIESYSQDSKNGKFQDLITFGTLLRSELLKYTKNLNFCPPKELKKRAAEFVYPKDPKGIARNKDGKAGGSFNKWDMYYALKDLDDNSIITQYIRKYSIEIEKNKSVPKPLEDLIDAYFLNVI